jgi:hypothetical protein
MKGVSTAHLGIEDRDLVYEQRYSYNLIFLFGFIKWGKVGVTRTQVPTRWIDQGANEE